VHHGDFLSLTWPSGEPRPDLIITNPPFKLAMEFLLKSVEIVSPTGHIFFLLRNNWIASRKRRSVFVGDETRKPMAPRLNQLSHRPSFTGDNKTDAADYSWFEWDMSRINRGEAIEGLIRWLDPLDAAPEPPDEKPRKKSAKERAAEHDEKMDKWIDREDHSVSAAPEAPVARVFRPYFAHNWDEDPFCHEESSPFRQPPMPAFDGRGASL
jgi:hypothetical protein